jgi:hypothetical protein
MYLDLGEMPLANNLEDTQEDAINAMRYPLQVMYCDKCGMSQLSVNVDPSILFKHYTYRSSINAGYRHHCNDMAVSLQKELKLSGKSFVIDIAGNDGALLREFQDILHCKGLNIDPAENLCKIAESAGVKCLPKFWNFWTAKEVLRYYGEADLITATNVFAHVDDTINFLRGIKLVLSKSGTFVLEFPYLVDLIDRTEFDTVYFEHYSYLAIHPVKYMCEKVGLKIYDIEKFDIHGGTVRVKIVHEENEIGINESVQQYLDHEIDFSYYNDHSKYEDWSVTVNDTILSFSDKIKELKKSGKTIAAFAASAKGNTLLNSAGIDHTYIDYIADETPEKIGKFSPGTGIPIVHIDRIRETNPDYIIILSWNFKDEIIEKLQDFYDNKFIIPIPKFEIV